MVPLLSLASAMAAAGDWTLGNDISLELIYSDNLTLDSQASAGFVATVRPGLRLKGEGARLKGAFEYRPSLSSQFGASENGSSIGHVLSSGFTATLVERSLFLDMNANANVAPTTASVSYSRDGLYLNEDQTQVYSFSLSPRSIHRFGSHSTLNLLAALSRVSGLGDTTDTSLGANLTSGPRFSRFPWSLGINQVRSRHDTRTDSRRSITATGGYRYSSSWLFNGTVARQNNHLYSSRAQTDGSRVSVSATWTPSPRTSASAEIGRSYFGRFLNMDFSHTSRRTRWKLDYQEDISSTSRFFLQRLVIPVEQEDGSFLDYLFYLPTTLDEDYLSRRLSGSVSATGKRTELSARLYWEDRQFEVTPAGERVMGLSASASRHLTPKFSVSLTASWQDSRSDLAPDDRVYDLGLSGSWQLGRSSSLSTGLAHRRSDRVGDGYRENRLSLTFKTKMF